MPIKPNPKNVPLPIEPPPPPAGGVPPIAPGLPSASAGVKSFYSANLLPVLQSPPGSSLVNPKNTYPGKPAPPPFGGSGTNNPNAKNPKPTGAPSPAGPMNPYLLAHKLIDDKLGVGWSSQFEAAHGMSPVEFYMKPENQFSFQRGLDPHSPEALKGAVEAATREGQMHQVEVRQWQQEHGGTAIPEVQWVVWYYQNRGEPVPKNVYSLY